MIIDFHTHIFPDAVAAAVVADAEENLELPTKGSGNEQGLRGHMRESGVDVSVALAVAPEGRLVRKTNDWLLNIRDSHLVFLGTIHPDMPDWDQEIARLKNEGVKGIKFNALLQKIAPDEKKMFPIYEKMAKEKMIALFHSGASHKERNNPSAALSTPERIARVMDAVPNLTIIAAHYGGNHMLAQVEEHLLGRRLYIDTAFPPDVFALDPQRIARLIRKHGAHQVLFGTDWPWERQERGIRYIRGLDLPEKEMDMILGGNAERLLFDRKA
ncbi:MAG: amidohydrolase family protein [Deltaproteobacteria bacterium]|nr:amidohydrolase family protein [Deltaproteobacteria bacterium]